MLRATAIGAYAEEIPKAVVLAMCVQRMILSAAIRRPRQQHW
jgi:hypothetical protein